MAVLSDRDILERVENANMIDPFIEKNLTPNGVDLTISEIMIDGELFEGEVFIAKPGQWFLVATAERLRMPEDIVANIWLRSSWVRKGLLSSFGVIDAGFDGTLTMSGFNAGPNNIDLPIGDRYCQVVFMEMTCAVDKAYADRSGSYQGKTGIVLPE